LGDLLDEKAREKKPVTIFPPGSEPANELGMTGDEIEDALASLRDFAREEKRRG
jgi:hypothetical protein